MASDQIQPSSEQSFVVAQSQVYVVEKHLADQEDTSGARVQCDSHGSHPIKSETTSPLETPSKNSFKEQMSENTQITALGERQSHKGPRRPPTDARETFTEEQSTKEPKSPPKTPTDQSETPSKWPSKVVTDQSEKITHDQAGTAKPGQTIADNQFKAQDQVSQEKGQKKTSSKWPPKSPLDEGEISAQGQPKPSKWPPKSLPDNNKTPGGNQATFSQDQDSKVVKKEARGSAKWPPKTPRADEIKASDQDGNKTSIQDTGKMAPTNIEANISSSKWPPKSPPNDSKIEGQVQGQTPASNQGKQSVKNGGKTPTKTQGRAFRKWPPEPSPDETGTAAGQAKTQAKSGDPAQNSGRPSLRKTSAKWRQQTSQGETSQLVQQGKEEPSPNPAKPPFKKAKWPPPKDQDQTPFQTTGKTPRKDEAKKFPKGF